MESASGKCPHEDGLLMTAAPRFYSSHLSDEEQMLIPDGFRLTLWAVPEQKRWTAIALEFDIAADGDSPDDAFQHLMELVEDYISVQASEGLSFDEMLRPVPLRVRLRAHWSAFKNRRRRPPRKGHGPVGRASRPQSLLRQEPLPQACHV